MSGPPSSAVPPNGTRPSVVEAEGLTVRYRQKMVWRAATFGVRQGEFAAVIGPNGAGKTTLFRMVLGLHRPASGVLRVFGAPPGRGNPKIGYVPQRHAITNETNIACEELVRLGYSGHRWGLSLSVDAERDAARRTLEAVGATELARKPLSALSGGELQRIFLAEALVADPGLLLLDEPLAQLDLRRARELADLVNRIVRERGVTALLVAHDINPLISYLDKVIYIANGRVAAGPPAEVLTSQTLSTLYGLPVEVLHDSRGRLVIVGGEDGHGDEPA